MLDSPLTIPVRKMLERRYFIYFLVPLIFVVSVNAIYALMSDPIDGDLTRLGGFMESSYGWNGFQEEIVKTPVFYANGIDDYDSHYDMVVIGDSFTFKSKSSWLDYFASISGVSVIAFKDSNVNIGDIVQSEIFATSPPSYLIYESVERKLLERLDKEISTGLNEGYVWKKPHNISQNRNITKKNSQNDLRVATLNRNIKWSGFDEILGQGFHYLSVNIKKNLFNASESVLRKKILEEFKGKLFSSRDRDSILIYGDDVKARNVALGDIDNAVSQIDKIVSVVQRNSRTKFLMLIFPDKLSIYQEFLSTVDWPQKGVFELIAERHSLVRTDLVFRDLVRNGALDIYLPNNTHTSYIGDRVVADEVLQGLEDHDRPILPDP